MGKTSIQWATDVWNPVTGCTKVSAGCKHCYAERVFPRAYHGQTVPESIKDEHGEWVDRPRRFTDVMCHPERLDQPLKWRKPRHVFVNSMSDLFHDAVPEGFIDQVFAVMARAPRHTFQILTKRPERLQQWMRLAGSRVAGRFWLDTGRDMPDWPLPNVWMGVSAEDQATFDQRVPVLLETPAAGWFVSLEPMIGAIDALHWLGKTRMVADDGVSGVGGIGWVIVGGESGPKARPFDIQWARDIVRQCDAAGVPVFVKQLGARPVIGPSIELTEWSTAKVLADADLQNMWEIRLKHRAGADPSEWPSDLRVQQFPEVAS